MKGHPERVGSARSVASSSRESVDTASTALRDIAATRSRVLRPSMQTGLSSRPQTVQTSRPSTRGALRGGLNLVSSSMEFDAGFTLSSPPSAHGAIPHPPDRMNRGDQNCPSHTPRAGPGIEPTLERDAQGCSPPVAPTTERPRTKQSPRRGETSASRPNTRGGELSNYTERFNGLLIEAIGPAYIPFVADPIPGVTEAGAEGGPHLSGFELEETFFDGTSKAVDETSNQLAEMVGGALLVGKRIRSPEVARDVTPQNDDLDAKRGSPGYRRRVRRLQEGTTPQLFTPRKTGLTPTSSSTENLRSPSSPAIKPIVELPPPISSKPGEWLKWSENRFLLQLTHGDSGSLSSRMCGGVVGKGVHKEVRDLLDQRKQNTVRELETLGAGELLNHQPSFWDQLVTQGNGSGTVYHHAKRKYVPQPPLHDTVRMPHITDPSSVKQRKLELDREYLEERTARWERKMSMTTSSGANAQFCAKNWLVWLRLTQASRAFANVATRNWNPFDESVREKSLFHPQRSLEVQEEMRRAGAVIKLAVFRFWLRLRIKRKNAAVDLLVRWLRVLRREMKLKFAGHHYLARVRRIQRNWRRWAAARSVRVLVWALQYRSEEKRLLKILHLEQEVAAASELEGSLGKSFTTPKKGGTRSSVGGFHSPLKEKDELMLNELLQEHISVSDLLPAVRQVTHFRPISMPAVMEEAKALHEDALLQCRADYKKYIEWLKMKRAADLEREKWRKENQAFLTSVETGVNPSIAAAWVGFAQIGSRLPDAPPRAHVPRYLKRRTLVEMFLKLHEREGTMGGEKVNSAEAEELARRQALSAAVRSEVQQALRRKQSTMKGVFGSSAPSSRKSSIVSNSGLNPLNGSKSLLPKALLSAAPSVLSPDALKSPDTHSRRSLAATPSSTNLRSNSQTPQSARTPGRVNLDVSVDSPASTWQRTPNSTSRKANSTLTFVG